MASIWKRATRFFRHRGKQHNKRAGGLVDVWDEEAPLHTDSFSNYMRSLQGPFFD